MHVILHVRVPKLEKIGWQIKVKTDRWYFYAKICNCAKRLHSQATFFLIYLHALRDCSACITA